jgi:hypothetical protein
MKSTLVFSTSKPDEDRRNQLTIERLRRKTQREIIRKINNPIIPKHKNSRKYTLNDLMFFELNNDAIEQQKLDILQNSELPLYQNFENTVQSYHNEPANSEHSIGWLIADYVLKFKR